MRISSTTDTPKTMEGLLPPALAARLDRLDVLSRKVFAGKLPGERRSKRRGQSVEFDDYREYTPGDDPSRKPLTFFVQFPPIRGDISVPSDFLYNIATVDFLNIDGMIVDPFADIYKEEERLKMMNQASQQLRLKFALSSLINVSIV